MTAIVVAAVIWSATALTVGIVIAHAIALAYADPPGPDVDLADLLDDVPVDCLSVDEVNRRAARLDVWL